MATVNRTPESENQNFKQIESDSWSNIYLPAICAGIVMTIVLFLAVSCSKKSGNSVAKISPPVSPAVESPAPAAVPPAVPEAAKKVVKKHRPANATYVNGTYGVSFSYPRKYSLQSGDKQKEMPVEAGFVKSGAVEIASVDMPDTGYPDTDFSSALLNVSVNTGMTSDECGQFAATAKGVAAKSDSPAEQKNTTDTAKASADSSTKPTPEAAKSTAESVKPAVIKLGTNEFSLVEQMKGTGEKQSDLKYFHLFKNGACYEFALDVETSRKADEELAQVDRGQVFKQLEKILTTTRIKDVELPGTAKTETAAVSQPAATPQSNASTQPATTVTATSAPSQTEKAQVITPEQK
jgi:hypothetical protein